MPIEFTFISGSVQGYKNPDALLPHNYGNLFLKRLFVVAVNKRPEHMNKKDKLSVRQGFENFVISREHPCLMAQSVVRHNHFDLYEYGALGNLLM
jgi:hypothetical protein